MYNNLQDDITDIINTWINKEEEFNDVTRLIIEEAISKYLHNLTIEKELFPYELKLMSHVAFDTSFIVHIGIYHTRNKYFVEPNSGEWISYKVQQILNKFKLNRKEVISI